jgi:dTDP-4-dehydrorhamnose 3,5-epimerase
MSFIEIVDGLRHEDERGFLSKFISFEGTLKGIRFPIAEVFRSKTIMGYVRGMHFQTGESANNRLIHILDGHVFTYFVDLRPTSVTLGEVFGVETTPGLNRTFIVPSGVAHGYYAITGCDVLYLSDQQHDASLDKGVSPLSSEFIWPKEPIGLSARDAGFQSLSDYTKNLRSN